jgi:hypothetical protein
LKTPSAANALEPTQTAANAATQTALKNRFIEKDSSIFQIIFNGENARVENVRVFRAFALINIIRSFAPTSKRPTRSATRRKRPETRRSTAKSPFSNESPPFTRFTQNA